MLDGEGRRVKFDPAQQTIFGDFAPDPAPPRPRRPGVQSHVSAGRRLRLLQRALPVIDPDPPGLDGWREYLTEPRPRIVNGVCSEMSERRQPDGTLAPCPRFACPHHLGIEPGEVVDIGQAREAEILISAAGLPVEMGRRKSLSPTESDHATTEAFQLAAIEALDRLPDSCVLEVIARYPDGAPIGVIATALGVSEEVVRLTMLGAGEKVDAEDLDPSPPDLAPELVAVAEAPETLRIVRHEREAPPPREPTAAEIFGDGW